MRVHTITHVTLNPHNLGPVVKHFTDFEAADACWHEEMLSVSDEDPWSVVWSEFDTDTGKTTINAYEESEWV
jgi:hypothetical protein